MPLSLRMVSFSASFCWLGWITPRDIFLAVSVKSPVQIQKNITNLRSLWPANEGKTEAVIYGVIRFRPCSDIRGQQLPVLHPTVSLPGFFFSVTGMRSCPGFHNEAGSCCVQGLSLIVHLGSWCTSIDHKSIFQFEKSNMGRK